MEPLTPANIVAAFRSNRVCQPFQRTRQDDWKTTMNNVKKLYLERRYKKCAALCEDALKNDVFELHPLHRTILQFFTAICYESLGQAAHNYSSNKLPFLNLAQQAFASAKNTLPLPYSSNEDGRYDSPAISPALTDFGSSTSVEAYQSVPITPTFESATPTIFPAVRACSSTASSSCSEDDLRTTSYRVPNFDDYSPRQPLQDLESLLLTDEFGYIDGNFHLRLPLSLKLDAPERHSDLAPKPLFIRKKSTIRDLPIPQRPLPPIPPCSALRSTQRQTALQVPPLINHYESLSTSPDASLSPISVHATAPCSLQLARYNANLTSFRTQLSAHITSVSEDIEKTTILQKEHKATQSKRLASYWMLKPGMDGSEEAERKVAEKKERIERLRQIGWRISKERFGWKGEEYYRELRRRAEVELRGWE